MTKSLKKCDLNNGTLDQKALLIVGYNNTRIQDVAKIRSKAHEYII